MKNNSKATTYKLWEKGREKDGGIYQNMLGFFEQRPDLCEGDLWLRMLRQK